MINGGLGGGEVVPPQGTGTGTISDITSTGGTITITGATGPTTNIEVTTLAGYLALAGGTMTGVIAMGAHKITGVANGTASTDVAAFGQIPMPANGYGIIHNSGLSPTPAVALTSAAASLGADVSLPQNTLTTIITTVALAVGTWHVTVGFPVETGAANESIDVETVVGTATATFSGQSASTVGYTQAVGGGVLFCVALNFLCVVTVPGTIVIQCEMAGGATAATVKYTSQTQGYANCAGYAAVRIG